MGEVTVTQCPNCGGPIDPRAYTGTDDPKCPHCQVALPTRQDPPPFVVPQFSIDVSGVGGATRKASKAGLIVVMTIILGTIGFVVFIIAVTSSASKHISNSVNAALGSAGSLRPDGPVIPVSAGAGQSDVYVVARSAGSQTEVLRRVDPVHRKVLWSGPSLDQLGEGTPFVVPGPTQVFTVYGSTVVAVDAATGTRLWQASISNSLASPCASGCAMLIGQHLVTLAKDGVVQGLHAATGTQTWSRRLNSTPRLLERAGTFVVVDDTPADSASGRVAIVADAATGAVHQITPICAPPDYDPAGGARPNEDDEFFVSPDGSSLTVLITGSGGCAAHYRIADGATLWVTPPSGDNGPVPFTLTGNSTAQGPGTLFWTNDSGQTKVVYALNTATGAIRSVLTVTKTELKMIGVVGPLLIVEAAPSYDSDKPAVLGIDIAAGAQRWQVATRVRLSGDTETVALTGAAPIIVSCNSGKDTCTFEAVDVATGTIKGASTVTASPASIDEVITRTVPGSLVAAVGWQHAVGFDPTTAAVQWKWPG